MTAIASTAHLRRPNRAVAIAGMTGGALVGVLVAWNPIAGVAVLFALLYAPLAMLNLPLAVGLWVPLLFLEGLPGTLMVPEAGAVVIASAWLGEAARRDSWQRQQLRRHGRLLTLVAVFIVWLALSLGWAEDPALGVVVLGSAIEVAAFFVLIATIIESPAHLRWAVAGFAAGTVLSALIGIGGQLAGLSGVEAGGRLQGASGDPNFFAAQLVAGLALATGLLATSTSALARACLTVSIAPLAYGIAASQSRGGFVALAAVGVAAIIVFRRQRAQILVLVACVGAVVGFWLANDSAAWERITAASEDRGSGREDLWRISLRMTGDQPIVGVGLSNFPVHAPEYTRLPGTLTGVGHVERDQEVHNAFLSLLAETGIVGLALFLGIAASALALGTKAAGRFEAIGDDRNEIMVRAIVVALAGMLLAAVFLPNAADKRIWVLMGLAVVSLAVAEGAAKNWRSDARFQ